jgi:ABC-type uncharacterized transport system permease subunit
MTLTYPANFSSTRKGKLKGAIFLPYISESCSTTAFAISIGATLYCFAAAIAPLHWYWHKSGRLDKDTIPNFSSYPLAKNASFTSSAIKSINFFIVVSFLYRQKLIFGLTHFLA